MIKCNVIYNKFGILCNILVSVCYAVMLCAHNASMFSDKPNLNWGGRMVSALPSV